MPTSSRTGLAARHRARAGTTPVARPRLARDASRAVAASGAGGWLNAQLSVADDSIARGSRRVSGSFSRSSAGRSLAGRRGAREGRCREWSRRWLARGAVAPRAPRASCGCRSTPRSPRRSSDGATRPNSTRAHRASRSVLVRLRVLRRRGSRADRRSALGRRHEDAGGHASKGARAARRVARSPVARRSVGAGSRHLRWRADGAWKRAFAPARPLPSRSAMLAPWRLSRRSRTDEIARPMIEEYRRADWALGIGRDSRGS